MENRRPPRPNSSGRKPQFGRGRGAHSSRDGNQTGNAYGNRDRSGNRSGDGSGQQSRMRAPDSRWRGGNRPDSRFGKNDGKMSGPNRFDKRKGDNGRLRSGKPGTVENEIKITSDCQVTDGRFRGRTLLNSTSPKTLHTGHKVREVVFKIISRRVKGGRILDLGAGCGTVGIEALSRGAMLATFVERSARMCTLIRKNLAEIGIKDGHGEVVETEILLFLKKMNRRKRSWDVVYFDLPSGDEHAVILDGLCGGCTIKSHGLLIVEHSSAQSHPDNMKQLRRWRTIEQGEKILSIYERM